MTLKILVFFIFQILGNCAYSQTCCSAGAPINTFLEIAIANENSLSFQLNYEFKSINLLVDNNERLQNDQRTRYGQDISLKLDYTLNSKWVFSALIPLVHHSRNTISESQNSFGIGDLSILAQYSLFSNQSHSISVSGGVKLPIGNTNHKGSSQIFLSPDMQSGSGSYNFILRTSYSKSNFLIRFMSSFVSLMYRKNGTNEHFGSRDNFGGRRFAFGNDFLSILGLRYMKTYQIGFVIPDLSLKIRWSTANIEQNIASTNSGGKWLSIPFGLSFVPDETKSLRLYTEIPIYQDLNGLQISTDFIIGIQFTYNKKGSKY